jgi:Uma2 family endonuclease
MVATPVSLPKTATIAELQVPTPLYEDHNASSLSPGCYDEVPEGMEEVDGIQVEKTGMTLQHAGVQSSLSAEWRAYSRSSQQGGKTFVEALCNTQAQRRRPDVAYVTLALLETHGQPSTFPQSFPLIGEIASPDDAAEDLFQKAREYLASGAEEVWIVLPESRMAFIVLADQVLAFVEGQMIATQRVLQGFAIALTELLA